MREAIGAEGGIVLGGIAERLDRSGDSSILLSRPLNAHLFPFVPLCRSLARSVVRSNTLITPGLLEEFGIGEPGGTGGIFRIGNGIWFPTIEMNQKSGCQNFYIMKRL